MTTRTIKSTSKTKAPAKKVTPKAPAKKAVTKAVTKVVSRQPKEFIPAWSEDQDILMTKGRKDAEYLTTLMNRALNINKRFTPMRHYYFQGPPGVGKTFTITRMCEDAKVKVCTIEGKATMAAFVRKLAAAVYRHTVIEKRKDYLFVILDDCTKLLMEKGALDVFKIALGETESLTWEVDLTGQVAKYAAAQDEGVQFFAEAMEYYRTNGGLGMEVPLHKTVFIFLSNHSLASQSDVDSAKPKSAKWAKLQDENALLDRVNYYELQQKRSEIWGLAAHVVWTTNIFNEFGITKAQRRDLLEYLYHNWQYLPATSLRQVSKLVSDMIDFPKDYRTVWDRQLKKP